MKFKIFFQNGHDRSAQIYDDGDQNIQEIQIRPMIHKQEIQQEIQIQLHQIGVLELGKKDILEML